MRNLVAAGLALRRGAEGTALDASLRTEAILSSLIRVEVCKMDDQNSGVSQVSAGIEEELD